MIKTNNTCKNLRPAYYFEHCDIKYIVLLIDMHLCHHHIQTHSDSLRH